MNQPLTVAGLLAGKKRKPKKVAKGSPWLMPWAEGKHPRGQGGQFRRTLSAEDVLQQIAEHIRSSTGIREVNVHQRVTADEVTEIVGGFRKVRDLLGGVGVPDRLDLKALDFGTTGLTEVDEVTGVSISGTRISLDLEQARKARGKNPGGAVSSEAGSKTTVVHEATHVASLRRAHRLAKQSYINQESFEDIFLGELDAPLMVGKVLSCPQGQWAIHLTAARKGSPLPTQPSRYALTNAQEFLAESIAAHAYGLPAPSEADQWARTLKMENGRVSKGQVPVIPFSLALPGYGQKYQGEFSSAMKVRPKGSAVSSVAKSEEPVSIPLEGMETEDGFIFPPYPTLERFDEVLQSIMGKQVRKHQPGQHDQSSHGRGGGRLAFKGYGGGPAFPPPPTKVDLAHARQVAARMQERHGMKKVNLDGFRAEEADAVEKELDQLAKDFPGAMNRLKTISTNSRDLGVPPDNGDVAFVKDIYDRRRSDGMGESAMYLAPHRIRTNGLDSRRAQRILSELKKTGATYAAGDNLAAGDSSARARIVISHEFAHVIANHGEMGYGLDRKSRTPGPSRVFVYAAYNPSPSTLKESWNRAHLDFVKRQRAYVAKGGRVAVPAHPTIYGVTQPGEFWAENFAIHRHPETRLKPDKGTAKWLNDYVEAGKRYDQNVRKRAPRRPRRVQRLSDAEIEQRRNAAKKSAEARKRKAQGAITGRKLKPWQFAAGLTATAALGYGATKLGGKTFGTEGHLQFAGDPAIRNAQEAADGTGGKKFRRTDAQGGWVPQGWHLKASIPLPGVIRGPARGKMTVGNLLPSVFPHQEYDRMKGRKKLFASSILGRMEYDKDRVYYYTPNSISDAVAGVRDVKHDIENRVRRRWEERANVGAFRVTPTTETMAAEHTAHVLARDTSEAVIRNADGSVTWAGLDSKHPAGTSPLYSVHGDRFLLHKPPVHVDLMAEDAEEQLLNLGMSPQAARSTMSRFRRNPQGRRKRSKARFVRIDQAPDVIHLSDRTALDQLRDKANFKDQAGKWVDPRFILDLQEGRVAETVTGGVRIAGHLQGEDAKRQAKKLNAAGRRMHASLIASTLLHPFKRRLKRRVKKSLTVSDLILEPVVKHPGHPDQSIHGKRPHRGKGSHHPVGRKGGGRRGTSPQPHDIRGRFTRHHPDKDRLVRGAKVVGVLTVGGLAGAGLGHLDRSTSHRITDEGPTPPTTGPASGTTIRNPGPSLHEGNVVGIDEARRRRRAS